MGKPQRRTPSTQSCRTTEPIRIPLSDLDRWCLEEEAQRAKMSKINVAVQISQDGAAITQERRLGWPWTLSVIQRFNAGMCGAPIL
jgi:hypothetical protein